MKNSALPVSVSILTIISVIISQKCYTQAWICGSSFSLHKHLSSDLGKGSLRSTLSEEQEAVHLASTNSSWQQDNISEAHHLRFSSVGRLFADSDTVSSPSLALRRLQQSTVAVVGLGGVGSWAAEALCRSGVGNLILIDLDDICISNTNRQLHTTSQTIGQMKIKTMADRCRQINPSVNIQCIYDFVSADNVHNILKNLVHPIEQHHDDHIPISMLLPNSASEHASQLLPPLTLVLDAIDGSTEKCALLATCATLAVPVITCGGAAGRIDPTQVVSGDLTVASKDKLLATCRKTLRRYHGFEGGLPFHKQHKIKNQTSKFWNIECVYSLEEQKTFLSDNKDVSSFRRCDGALGTASFVTGTYGFVAAARAVQKIATNSLSPPRKSSE